MLKPVAGAGGSRLLCSSDGPEADERFGDL
jgi:hypothetical protein